MKKILKALLLPCALVLLMGADNQEARFQNLGGKIMCTLRLRADAAEVQSRRLPQF